MFIQQKQTSLTGVTKGRTPEFRRARKAVAAGAFFRLNPKPRKACAVPEVLEDCILDGGAGGGIPPAHAQAVQRIGGKAELGGGGYKNFIGGFQKVHGEGLFQHRNTQPVADADHVALGDAPENELVVGMGIQNPVLQDGDVGMGAFGDDVAPVENGLRASGAVRPLGGHHIAQQIQGFDVAVEEAGVFLVVKTDEDVGVGDDLGTNQHPQLAGQVLGIGVAAVFYAAAHLPVYEAGLALHLLRQPGKKLAQRLLFHGDVDIQQPCAGVKPVKMVFQQEYGAVCRHGGVIAAVAEEVNTVIEGDCQFLGCADLAVVIGQCFHGIRPPYNI